MWQKEGESEMGWMRNFLLLRDILLACTAGAFGKVRMVWKIRNI
jgi:hypothetical protein